MQNFKFFLMSLLLCFISFDSLEARGGRGGGYGRGGRGYGGWWGPSFGFGVVATPDYYIPCPDCGVSYDSHMYRHGYCSSCYHHRRYYREPAVSFGFGFGPRHHGWW